MPSNKSSMHSKLKFDFENDNFNLSAGFDVYEELGTKKVIGINIFSVL